MTYPVVECSVQGMDSETGNLCRWYLNPELLERLAILTDAALKAVGCSLPNCTFGPGRKPGESCFCQPFATMEVLATALLMSKALDQLIRHHFEPADSNGSPLEPSAPRIARS